MQEDNRLGPGRTMTIAWVTTPGWLDYLSAQNKAESIATSVPATQGWDIVKDPTTPVQLISEP